VQPWPGTSAAPLVAKNTATEHTSAAAETLSLYVIEETVSLSASSSIHYD
jgi:hypothetical protein